jgi:hypothetical protein
MRGRILVFQGFKADDLFEAVDDMLELESWRQQCKANSLDADPLKQLCCIDNPRGGACSISDQLGCENTVRTRVIKWDRFYKKFFYGPNSC